LLTAYFVTYRFEPGIYLVNTWTIFHLVKNRS